MNCQIKYIVLYLLFWVGGANAAENNLALYHKLEYVPKPNYQYTSHPLDPYLLTDGIKDKSLWYKKYQKKTVGWFSASLIEIIFDLERVCNVGFVRINTVGGGLSGVEYPRYAVAGCSSDGEHYQLVGYVDTNGWEFNEKKAIARTLVLPVEKKCRYLKLWIKPTGTCFFADEIEVVESQNSELQSTSFLYQSKEEIINFVERATQLQCDLDVLDKWSQNSSSTSRTIVDDHKMLAKQITGLNQILTLKKLEEAEKSFEVFRAKQLRNEYQTDWLCYLGEPMKVLRNSDLPAFVPEKVTLNFYQWKNEYASNVINLVNCSPSPIIFSIDRPSLYSHNKTFIVSGLLEIRRALYIQILNEGLVADPLVLQNSKPFSVQPGQIVQLWLESHSQGLEAGLYNADMIITAQGNNIDKIKQVVTIHLEVANKKYLNKIPFRTYNWDYISANNRFTSKNQRYLGQAVADLNSHYVNTTIILFSQIIVDNKFSFYKLKNDLDLRNDNKPFVLFFGGNKKNLETKFGKLKTKQWESNFTDFLRQLRDFMLSNGFGYNTFALYPFDEKLGDDFIYVAQVIRKFDPQLKIYANKWIEPKEFSEVKDLIDYWCPGITEVLTSQKQYERYKTSSCFDQIWCYTADLTCERFLAKSQKQDIRHWRTLPIVAAAFDMQGAGFWTYIDNNQSGWDKNQRGSYGVVYDGRNTPDKECIPELIVPSKRWQMWREGVEDAVCLSGHPELLQEFLNKPNDEITCDFIMQLRKKADSKTSQ